MQLETDRQTDTLIAIFNIPTGGGGKVTKFGHFSTLLDMIEDTPFSILIVSANL